MIKFNRFYFVSSIIGLLIVQFLIFGSLSSAQESNGNNVGLSISPPSFELTTNPGDNLSEVIKVTNRSSNNFKLEAVIEDFKVEGTEGVVTLQEPEENNPNDFSKWFQVDPQEFDLSANETKLINFKITIPQDGEPGGHFASLIFQPKSITSSEYSGARTIQRIGALILLSVSGDAKEEGLVSRFNTKTFFGQWDETLGSDNKTKIYIAKNEQLEKEKAKKYFNSGPVAFDLVFKNNGNVHFKPIGTIKVYNLFGKQIANLIIPARNVFPGGERRVTVIWPKKHLWGGYYRADAIAVFGSKNQALFAKTVFWAFPFWAAFTIIAVIIILILARRRIIKAIRILIKGQP